MTEGEIRDRVIKTLSGIVPGLDTLTLKPGARLRDQIDIDSMDVLNFLFALHQEFGVDVPESDAAKLATVDACVAYFAQAMRQCDQA